ncbi:MAG: tRNA uridine(34) 5-carboxymethylaminomethyl modification radical SAM/GNAT enzyme Elp3 [Deltaproteobacteria bacterium]|nr:tRNA uridine(34) 5-carboxymethylaminomethyl modification radical SAM/GNAT enzyme Elp3 [Deltaproteobacteria bacterium]
MSHFNYEFQPELYLPELKAVIREVEALETLEPKLLDRIVRRHPKGGKAVFSKSEIIRGYRWLALQEGRDPEAGNFIARLRKKPIRTLSGVAPVTVLTKPFPCPGKCIFCPNDVRMPKSYLSNEPGAQRAANHAFDPYLQTYFRLRTFHNTGHRVDKVELIVLGGTWSFYPEEYQVWFIKRCFDALNDFGSREDPEAIRDASALGFEELDEEIDGSVLQQTYNQVVSGYLRERQEGQLLPPEETASWGDLKAVQEINEGRPARCVGLVLETRPDHISPEEVIRLRRLGATKVQIGFQSLSDEVLAANKRGHDVAATRRAMVLLRQGGFKLHAHWMPNLYGSSPGADVEDFQRLFGDPDFRPDELKVYPCSLIESAELMSYYRNGSWQPYSEQELLEVLVRCLELTPEYCRLTRIIRDIPSQDILVGNKLTNFRQLAEQELARRGGRSRDIRSREVRGRPVEDGDLSLRAVEYETPVGREIFLQFVTTDDYLAGFLRLSLPQQPSFIEEIAASAMIREIHVYGALAGLGKEAGVKAQHRGLGRRLTDEALRRAAAAGFNDLAVISSVGTRHYYRGLGFEDGELYQHRRIGRENAPPTVAGEDPKG